MQEGSRRLARTNEAKQGALRVREDRRRRFCRSKARWTIEYDCYVLLMKRESRTGWRQKAVFCLHTSSALS